MWPKIKAAAEDWTAEWGLITIIFLVALSAFGLGRLSALEEARPLVAISQAPVEKSPQALTVGGLFVASKTGSVYYFPWCTGASKILPQNQRWFDTETAALKAGYAPAKACKGLAGN